MRDLIVTFGEGLAWLTKQLFFLSLAFIVGQRLYGIEKERLIANDRALRAQADERQRVARDMHDTIGQWLGSVKLRLQKLGSEVSKGEEVSQERLSELVGDMDIIISDTRRIARDLSPSSIAHKGLFAALREHMTYLDDDYGIAVALEMDESILLPEKHADHFYRIVQEASNNAVIHGNARSIAVVLRRLSDGKVHLSIQDDGCGFETNKEQERHSLGLSSIKERAAMMNGTMTIESAPDQGTKINLMI